MRTKDILVLQNLSQQRQMSLTSSLVITSTLPKWTTLSTHLKILCNVTCLG